MDNIKDIYKVEYRYGACFVGTLRNERRFEIDQKVFIGTGYGESIKIYPGIIKGIKYEDLEYGIIKENPIYIYDVQVPNWVVEEIKTELSDLRNKELSEIPFYRFLLRRRVKQFYEEHKKGGLKYKNLRCDKIFKSIEQAKKSVLENHEKMTKLNRDDIDRYFDRFDKTTF